MVREGPFIIRTLLLSAAMILLCALSVAGAVRVVVCTALKLAAVSPHITNTSVSCGHT